MKLKVTPRGFEPPANSLGNYCSIQLSYGAKNKKGYPKNGQPDFVSEIYFLFNDRVDRNVRSVICFFAENHSSVN